MKKKGLELVLPAILALIIIASAEFVDSAEANPHVIPSRVLGSIYIEVDGRVTPASSSIQVSGNVYTFTENITCSGIWILRNGVVLDGAGYTLVANQSAYSGVVLNSTKNVTVKNLQITGFYVGVFIQRQTWDPYTNWAPTTQENPFAKPDNNTIRNCSIVDNKKEGILATEAINSKISGNLIAGNDVGVKIYQNLEDTVAGNEISRNELKNNGCGIQLEASAGNKITRNEISSNSGYGIELHFSSNNVLSENTITHNGFGILIDGPEFSAATNNRIITNLVAENDGWAMRLTGAMQGNNYIYRNNFVNNNAQNGGFPISIPLYMGAKSGGGYVIGSGRGNFWNDNSGGNYWGSFMVARYPNATELGKTGVWDTPFYINENNIDNHPLIKPVANSNLPTLSEPEPQTDATTVDSFRTIGYAAIPTIVAIALGSMLALHLRKSKQKPR